MRARVPVVVVGVLVLLAACEEPMCGCEVTLPEINATVFGHVLTPDSTPIDGGLVELEGGLGDCANADDRIHLTDVYSEPDGAYVTSIVASGLDDDEIVCVRARAHPPQGSGFGPSAYLEMEFDEADFYTDVELEHDFYLTAP